MLPDQVHLLDGHYDLIVLLDVLEHIEDDRGSLRVLREKLAPGGMMVVTVPASPWMWSAHDVAHHHKRRYTARTLRAVFDAAGLRVRHMSHFNTLLYPLIAAARIVGRLRHREGSDEAMPSPLVNGLLRHVFAAERHWVTRGALPFGVSLLAVVDPVER
jgi:SAM-dependent methyltransferase